MRVHSGTNADTNVHLRGRRQGDWDAAAAAAARGAAAAAEDFKEAEAEEEGVGEGGDGKVVGREGRVTAALMASKAKVDRKGADGREVDEEEDGGEQRDYTVDEAIDAMGFGRLQVLLVLYTGMAWLADAMEMILLSFVGPAARCEFGLTATQEGFISSVVFLGVFLSSYVWGFLADSKGRRIGFMVPALCTLCFGIMSAFAPSYWLLLLFRMMVGAGIGGATVVFSLCSEFLPSTSRGFWLVFIEVFWTIGTLLEALLAWVIMPYLHWRVLVLVSALPFLVLMAAYPWLPESPSFLLEKGDVRAAQHMLQQTASFNGQRLPPGRLIASKAAAPYPSPPPVPHSVAGWRDVEDSRALLHAVDSTETAEAASAEKVTIAGSQCAEPVLITTADGKNSSNSDHQRRWQQQQQQQKQQEQHQHEEEAAALELRFRSQAWLSGSCGGDDSDWSQQQRHPDDHLSPIESRLKFADGVCMSPTFRHHWEQQRRGQQKQQQQQQQQQQCDSPHFSDEAGVRHGLLQSHLSHRSVDVWHCGTVEQEEADGGRRDSICPPARGASSGSSPWQMFHRLFSRPLFATTLVLWLVFFSSAFTYYGLVLLTTQLSVSDSASATARSCAAAAAPGASAAAAAAAAVSPSLPARPAATAAAAVEGTAGVEAVAAAGTSASATEMAGAAVHWRSERRHQDDKNKQEDKQEDKHKDMHKDMHEGGFDSAKERNASSNDPSVSESGGEDRRSSHSHPPQDFSFPTSADHSHSHPLAHDNDDGVEQPHHRQKRRHRRRLLTVTAGRDASWPVLSGASWQLNGTLHVWTEAARAASWQSLSTRGNGGSRERRSEGRRRAGERLKLPLVQMPWVLLAAPAFPHTEAPLYRLPRASKKVSGGEEDEGTHVPRLLPASASRALQGFPSPPSDDLVVGEERGGVGVADEEGGGGRGGEEEGEEGGGGGGRGGGGGGGGDGGEESECLPNGQLNISAPMYRDVFVTSCAELPGLVAALLLVERFGSKRVLWWLLLAAGVFILPLWRPLPELPTTALLFASRAAIMGSFSVLWAYTPTVYPTEVRATGLSIANSWGRVGGFVCPFVAVGLVSGCQRELAIGLFFIMPVLAALATALSAQDTQVKYGHVTATHSTNGQGGSLLHAEQQGHGYSDTFSRWFTGDDGFSSCSED